MTEPESCSGSIAGGDQNSRSPLQFSPSWAGCSICGQGSDLCSIGQRDSAHGALGRNDEVRTFARGEYPSLD
jgi:hypothetical protein